MRHQRKRLTIANYSLRVLMHINLMRAIEALRLRPAEPDLSIFLPAAFRSDGAFSHDTTHYHTCDHRRIRRAVRTTFTALPAGSGVQGVSAPVQCCRGSDPNRNRSGSARD